MVTEMAAYDDGYPGHGGHGGSFYSSAYTTSSNTIPGKSTTSDLTNTYYIYTFDGRFLAEYDHNGSYVRDYIYAGNRLLAEYKPQTNEYFYYMTHQINFTRIITNGSGEIKRLKDGGVDIHELKEGGDISKSDLFKNKKGDIYVKPKSGKGPEYPTGLNINDF